MQHLSGQLLIASPGLVDPNFRQTVVLMIQDAEEGSLGLVLNRPSDKSIRELWKSIFHSDKASEQPVNLGGPVFGPLMLLHTRKELADLEITAGLFFSTQKEYIERIVNEDVRPYKLFLGHSGWGEGQLQAEIDEGAWFQMSADRDLVFGNNTELWQQLLHYAGRMSLSRILNSDQLPEDPSLN